MQFVPRAAGLRLGHQIKADIGVGHGLDLGLGDADQDDGFGMLDQLDAQNPGVRVDGDHRMDGFAGIAGGADEIAGDKGPADGLAAFQDRRDRQVTADRAKAVGAGGQFRGVDLGQEFLEDRGGPSRLSGQSRHQQDQRESGEAKGAQQRGNPGVRHDFCLFRLGARGQFA